MKNLIVILAVAGFISVPLVGGAENVSCFVEADTFILHGGINFGYPDSTCARATNWVGAEVLFRFDLSQLEQEGWTADDVGLAVFYVYTGQGTGMMAHPMAPAGTTQQAQVLALRTWNPNIHPYSLTYWTEALRGDHENGYIDGSVQSQSGYPNIYDPGDAGGIDPYHYEDWELNPGFPSAVMVHSCGPGVPADWNGDPANLNPGGWVSVDLTDFVKAWLLPEGDLGHIDNNGIRIHDLGGWSGNPDPNYSGDPNDPTVPNDNEWGWYFMTKDVGGYQSSSHPKHPGGAYVPYLEVVDILGDLNDDDRVDLVDFDLFARQWLQSCGLLTANLNVDGTVDLTDLTLFSENWLKGKPSP